MRLVKKVAAALLSVALVLSVCPAKTANAFGSKMNTYTYNYDYWGHEYESPDAYRAVSFIGGKELGITDMKLPDGLFATGNKLYVMDSGNNRILELDVTENELTFVREITEVHGTDEQLTIVHALKESECTEDNYNYTDAVSSSLNNPKDVFVNDKGELYIADTGNYRMLHVDADLNVLDVITRPNDTTLSKGVEFEPTKLTVDPAGRTILMCKNVNKGFLRFEPTGEFIGFMGANKVVLTLAQKLKRLFSTKEQREKMESFVPTEYNNIYIDSNSFIYCTTQVFKEAEAQSGTATPIRKLNSYGDDILIRNGWVNPIGDWDWDDAAGMNGPSRMADITAMPDETYYTVDRVRGRIFAFDEQGHFLYAFGGPGNKIGYFTLPTAIEHIGTDLFVLDGTLGAITRFKRTEFGNMIHEALNLYMDGKYDESADYWKKVVERNGNYELAYIGIGRSLLRQKDYEGAMEYFETMKDGKNYSRAWKYYRKEWVEDNMGTVIVILIVIFALSFGVKTYKRIRWEARLEYEHERKLRKKNK